MSFLDEGTFVGRNAVDDAMKDPEFKALKSDEKQKAIAKLKAGGSVTTEKKGKDLDGDGDIDSKDYLAARDKAIKKAMGKEVEEGKLSKTLGGVAVLATLLGLNKAASEKIYKGDPKIKSLTTQYEKAKEDGDKKAMAKFEKEIKNRKTQIDTGKMDEAKKTVELPADTTFTLDLKHLIKKHLDKGKSQEDVVKLTKALMKKLHNKGEVKVNGTKVIFKEMRRPPGGPSTNKEKLANLSPEERKKYLKDLEKFSDFENIDLGGMDELDEAFARSKDNPFVPDSAAANSFEGARKKAKENGEDTFKFNGKVYKTAVNEASVMGVPLESFADYYTALELATNVGVPVVAFSALLAIMGVKEATKYLKKGKEAVMAWYEQHKLNEQEDTQLALPEPDAPDFLGDDGIDYEGGMAKSQMLKMKKYAAALCDMIEDESQLEAWVQAKLTKASDYMSAVYHYLDYQQSKMNEGFELNNRKVVDLEGEADGEDSYITAAYYSDTGKRLSDDEIEDLVNKYPADLNPGGAWWDQQR